jgi:polar amino acid transport system substrate-binding protein
MKKLTTLFALAVTLLLTSCGLFSQDATQEAQPTDTIQPTDTLVPTPTGTNTSTPTQAPTSSGDLVWDRVQSEGKIVFGTSADYPPFEYYDADYEIIGFDAALARNIGEQLAIEVELVDFAFEGLPAALQTGQIDAAIAAISVTPERQDMMDFTNVYFTGQDEILARQNSGVPTIVSPAQLAPYRVGAQRGSVYATWIEETLIGTGLMPQGNLLLYDKASEAVRDLRQSRNDLVILDKLAADEYIISGGVVSVGRGLNRQLFAIALPKGASILQAQLNEALISLQNDGTIARLTDVYLDLQLPIATPTPEPTPTARPQPTATPLPRPTATPSVCYDGMEFVQDIEVSDGTEFQPGADFDKVWRIRNTGTCTWNSNYKIVFVQGDRMEGTSQLVKTNVRPGETYDMIIDQRAPTTPGKYTGIWQMVNANGTPFGERIWVKITVPGAVQPTPVPPTSTPVPAATPTVPNAPTIEYLNVSSVTISQGDLLVVSWSFYGESLVRARLTRTNPDGTQTPLMGGIDVQIQGQYEDIMMFPGTYSYTLVVDSEFGGKAVKTVVVNVSPAVPGNPLQDVEWVLSWLVNPIRPDVLIPPLDGTELTIIFNSDGSVSGTTGCNPFNSTYVTFEPSGIDIDDNFIIGQALCPENVMGQQDLYLDLLRDVEQLELTDNGLILKARNIDPNINEYINVFLFERR